MQRNDSSANLQRFEIVHWNGAIAKRTPEMIFRTFNVMSLAPPHCIQDMQECSNRATAHLHKSFANPRLTFYYESDKL